MCDGSVGDGESADGGKRTRDGTENKQGCITKSVVACLFEWLMALSSSHALVQ
jgi:hypothetical protein